MFKRILTPVDDPASETAGQTLAQALKLAETFGADLVVMTVRNWIAGRSDKSIHDLHEEFDARVSALNAASKVTVSSAFRAGDSISMTVSETVAELEIDLIVMSTHAPAVSDYVLGSKAASVALHAPCSVMVLK